MTKKQYIKINDAAQRLINAEIQEFDIYGINKKGRRITEKDLKVLYALSHTMYEIALKLPDGTEMKSDAFVMNGIVTFSSDRIYIEHVDEYFLKYIVLMLSAFYKKIKWEEWIKPWMENKRHEQEQGI